MKTNLHPPAASSTILYDQSYRPDQRPEVSQSLDLYIPEGQGPFPLVIWIHGGGWAQYDKKLDFAPVFLREGLALASLNYRLTAKGHPFPAQIEDCLFALAWLREHGEKWGIDSNKIGLSGHSAGAHLAALLASICTTRHFDACESPSVQAVAGLAGPYDLGRERAKWPRSYFVWNPDDPFCTKFFGGGVYDENFARWASPASYLRKGLPPMLLIHGAKDDIVPAEQAEAYAKSLVDWGGEANFRLEAESNHDIMTQENLQEIASFLKGKLRM